MIDCFLYLHTEKSHLNLIESNQGKADWKKENSIGMNRNQIIFNIFRLIWNLTGYGHEGIDWGNGWGGMGSEGIKLDCIYHFPIDSKISRI